jgi:hypothetical protein
MATVEFLPWSYKMGASTGNNYRLPKADERNEGIIYAYSWPKWMTAKKADRLSKPR